MNRLSVLQNLKRVNLNKSATIDKLIMTRTLKWYSQKCLAKILNISRILKAARESNK